MQLDAYELRRKVEEINRDWMDERNQRLALLENANFAMTTSLEKFIAS